MFRFLQNSLGQMIPEALRSGAPWIAGAVILLVSWYGGKAFDNAAPMGPVVATPDEVPDDASIELRVDGETKQSSSIDQFIFSVPELIAEITTHLTLEPGDVISTGTPAGVGPLSDGDHVAVEIEGIGTLEHDVQAASR